MASSITSTHPSGKGGSSSRAFVSVSFSRSTCSYIDSFRGALPLATSSATAAATAAAAAAAAPSSSRAAASGSFAASASRGVSAEEVEGTPLSPRSMLPIITETPSEGCIGGRVHCDSPEGDT